MKYKIQAVLPPNMMMEIIPGFTVYHQQTGNVRLWIEMEETDEPVKAPIMETVLDLDSGDPKHLTK